MNKNINNYLFVCLSVCLSAGIGVQPNRNFSSLLMNLFVYEYRRSIPIGIMLTRNIDRNHKRKKRRQLCHAAFWRNVT